MTPEGLSRYISYIPSDHESDRSEGEIFGFSDSEDEKPASKQEPIDISPPKPPSKTGPTTEIQASQMSAFER